MYIRTPPPSHTHTYTHARAHTHFQNFYDYVPFMMELPSLELLLHNHELVLSGPGCKGQR